MSILIVSDTGASCLCEVVAPGKFQVRLNNANGRTRAVWNVNQFYDVRPDLYNTVTLPKSVGRFALQSFLSDLRNHLGRAGFSADESRTVIYSLFSLDLLLLV